MEKDPQPDSLTDVTVKQYAPSEVFSTEPPPAYHKMQSSAVQVARIAAITVVAVSVVLGSCILASAYISANATCAQLEAELEMLQRDNYLPPQAEALVQNEPMDQHRHVEHETHAETKMEPRQQSQPEKVPDVDNSIDSQDSEEDDDSSEEDDRIRIKLPLQLDFDELAGALMERNQRSRMNCVVERKRAEEVVDHQPKTVRLPFGLNLTTDPRYEHVTGERMAIFCESGDEQRPAPQQQEETMMIQPIIVPIPDPSYQRQAPQQPQHPQYQMQQMRPMLPPHLQMLPQHRPMVPPQMRPDMQMVPEGHQMRPDMVPPHMRGDPQIERIRTTIVMQQLPQQGPGGAAQQGQMPPAQLIHPLLQHIAQQIIAQHEAGQNEEQNEQQHHNQIPQHVLPHHVLQMAHRMPEGLPIPEEILSQINRLPNQDVTVSVSEHEAEEVPQENVRVVQRPRESAHEMNGRQSYARGLPVHIPVPMMQQVHQPVQQEQEQQESRPHYVQPRSIRSVDGLLRREKRVKRCSCNCAC